MTTLLTLTNADLFVVFLVAFAAAFLIFFPPPPPPYVYA